VSSDCTTGSCLGGVCAQPTTCSNRVKDAGEGDVDCGGQCDRQCGVAGTCNLNSDCISNVCRYGTCASAPNCYNNIKDGRETGRGSVAIRAHADRSAPASACCHLMPTQLALHVRVWAETTQPPHAMHDPFSLALMLAK
jgi:hypothetical protein